MLSIVYQPAFHRWLSIISDQYWDYDNSELKYGGRFYFRISDRRENWEDIKMYSFISSQFSRRYTNSGICYL